MRTSISINGLKLYCRHGAMEQERRVGNWFEVSAVIDYPFDNSDHLSRTLNYAEAVDVIKEVMSRPVNLIETAAMRIRTSLLKRYPSITRCRVTVAKIKPPIDGAEMDSVAVTVE